jgi:RNA polymerase-binding transcription factor DksA
MGQFEIEAREVLLRRRARLVRRAGALPADPSARWTDYESTTTRPPVDERELGEIDAALRRIADGSFGACLACGGPLGLHRLRALPEARYCLGCAGQVVLD